jgi:hypothetical protein
MSDLGWVAGALVALIAGLVALAILLFIFRVVASLTGRFFGSSAAAIVQLFLGTVLDIRFLALIALNLAIVAGYEGGSWPALAFLVSLALFITAIGYIVLFYLSWLNWDVFKFDKNRITSQFWAAFKHSIMLNIGFIGIFYTIFSFGVLSYSYALLSVNSNEFPTLFYTHGASGLGEFIWFACETAYHSLPIVSKHYPASWSDLVVRENGFFNAILFIYKTLIYGALGAIVVAIFQKKE